MILTLMISFINHFVGSDGLKVREVSCDWIYPAQTSWINLSGQSEEAALTTTEGPLTLTAPVELLSGQQIRLWLYWAASRHEYVTV